MPLKFPAQQMPQHVPAFDRRISALTISDLVKLGQEAVEIILQASPSAQVNISIERAVETTRIQNLAGLDVSFERTPVSGYIEVIAVQGDDVLILGDLLGFTLFEDAFRTLAQRFAEKLVLARKISTVKSGRQPVLFTPNGSPVLALPLREGLNGKNIFLGASPLCGKLGEKLFDEKLTLVDDGTLVGRFSSSEYDDEGVPRQRLPLIEAGSVKNFYYDLKTACQSNRSSTGNASRSLFTPPGPATSNLVIQPGTKPLKEIIAEMDDGILVDSVLGLGQGNILSGAFSNPLDLAFRIENGEITGRIKGASIAGNVYDDLKKISALSSEREWVYQNFYSPYILIDEMNVVTN